ncbi:MAG: hypothetical protein AAGF47_07460 [Planctomycetota bacterium]
MNGAAKQPEIGTAWSVRALALAGGLVFAAILASLVGTGAEGPDAFGNVASVLYLLPVAGLAPTMYLLAAMGLGMAIVHGLAPGTRHPWALAFAAGLAAMLSLTHGLGIAGLLSNRAAALAPVAIGVALVARRLPMAILDARRSGGPSLWWLLAMPAGGVLLAAACTPPGWLWASEFGGYDSLSYHLQLPREWHAAGRVWPVEHNVYSYLPSFVEAAFVHLASITGVPRDGFVSAQGTVLISSKLLHALITLGAAWVMSAAGRSWAERAGAGGHTQLAGFMAGGLTLATPWAVVTGSLAYNEMAVVLLVGGAMLAASDERITPVRRGVLCGLLMGAACGCKPTALLFGAPVVGIALLGCVPKRSWLACLAACAGVGFAMLLPWLARNWIASGNPVFPQLARLFGSGHWSAEQVARYAGAHSFDDSIFDALRLLVLADPTDPAAGTDPMHRGLLHRQWALTAPLLAVAGSAGLLMRQTRFAAAVLAVGIVSQIAAWALLTHVQSRFLLPVLVPGALLVGIAAAAGCGRGGRAFEVAGAMLARGAVALTALITVWLFAGEGAGRGGPNALLAAGPAAFVNPAFAGNDPQLMSPEQFMASQLPAGSHVLLIGDATPLYKPPGTAYATTWDTSPAAAALRRWPEDPAKATAELAESYSHVYFGLAELSRLHATGWGDPTLDPDRIASWLRSTTRAVRVFPGGRSVLLELPTEPGR